MMNKKKSIIVDIDGTLANIEKRRYHVAGGKKNWVAFFEDLDNDAPIQQVIDITNRFYEDGYHVFLCSGRPDNYKERTINWMNKHGVKYHDLIMRVAGDYRSDVIVKGEMLQVIKIDHEVYFTIDDRQKVVDYWRSEGLVCFQCAPGDFDKPKSEQFQTKKVWEDGSRPNLYIMVGPSGAGKSTFLESSYISRWSKNTQDYILKDISNDMVISSDKLRSQLCNGNFKDQSRNEDVFAAMHELTRTRLKYGLDVVLDATHVRNKDRKYAVEIGREFGALVHYVVIDRQLKQKLNTGGWRLDVNIKGKNLIEHHDQTFNSNLSDILNKDGFTDVIIHDFRS